MHKRHAQIALRGQSKALEWLEQLTPEQLRHGIGVRLLAEATKLERLARGANTEELGMTADVTVGPSRTLGELFQVPQGMTELELARVVVERATRPEGSFGPDGDGLVDDGLVASDPEDDPDDTDPAEAWPAAAAVPDLPEPEREPEPDPEPEVDPVAAQVAAYLNTLGPITDRERKTIGADFRARLEERARHLFAAGNLRLDPDAASAGKDPDRRAPRPPPRPASSHVTLVPSEELELLRQGIDPRATEGR